LFPKDKEAYLRGELVEPEEPIIYYLDPGTSRNNGRSPFNAGIEDWHMLHLGHSPRLMSRFQKKIIGKEAPTPEEDP